MKIIRTHRHVEHVVQCIKHKHTNEFHDLFALLRYFSVFASFDDALLLMFFCLTFLYVRFFVIGFSNFLRIFFMFELYMFWELAFYWILSFTIFRSVFYDAYLLKRNKHANNAKNDLVESLWNGAWTICCVVCMFFDFSINWNEPFISICVALFLFSLKIARKNS